MDFGRYYAGVFVRALRDTWRFLWAEVRIELAIVVAVFAVALLLQDDGSTADQISGALVFPLLALVFVVGSAFLWHVAWAPVATDRERRARIAELSPKHTLKLDLDLSELYWAHVLVTNVGPTDEFVAQLVSVEGGSAVLPFSLKWRQSDEEAQQIIRGQTKVLDFARIGWSSGWRRDEGRGTWCYLIIYSTTAEVPFGDRYVQYFGEKDKELVAEATDEELSRPVQFLVVVRGAAYGSVGKGWTSLGFKRDEDGNLTPDGTMETVLSD